MGLVLNFSKNHFLKIFAPQNVESEKSDRSLSSAVFFLLSLCYFNVDSTWEHSNLWILGTGSAQNFHFGPTFERILVENEVSRIHHGSFL